MKRLVSILLFCTAICASASTDFTDCFIPGEVAEYKVTWMKIPLAWTRMEVEGIKEDGRDLIRLRMTAKTYKAYTHIYKVDDVTEVVLDPATALPLRLDKVLNEGTIHKSYYTTFDHAKLQATHIDRISNTTNTVAIRNDTKELLSFLYSVRKQELPALANEIHELFVDGKLYEMGIEIRKKKAVKLPNYGKVDSIQVEPVAEFDGIFLRQGKIFFWVSKQNRRMVTYIQAKVAVGKVSVKLQDVKGPGDDFWIKKEEANEDQH